MTIELNHDEIRGLLGAYSLDAVDAEEARQVSAHLTTCASCREEVSEHREVAALLAGEPLTVPDAPWRRIEAQLSASRPRVERPLRAVRPATDTSIRPVEHAGNQRRPWTHAGPRWAWPAAAAVLLVAVLALGVFSWHQGTRIDRVNQQVSALQGHQSLADAAARAVTSPGAQQVTLNDGEDHAVAKVVLLRDGTAYLIPAPSLASLDNARTYQLWGVTDTEKLSLGVLGADPGTMRLKVPLSINALAITAERSPGAVQPTTSPVAAGKLRNA